MFGPALEDQFCDDNTMQEEYTEDALFSGKGQAPSFRVGRDFFAGNSFAVRPADGGLHPFWDACAVTNPNSDLAHANAIQL
jgi:hypothetical protein